MREPSKTTVKKSNKEALKKIGSWWKLNQFRNHTKLYSLLAVILAIAVFPLPHTSTEILSVPYTTQNIQSSEIELGENQVNQQGTNGQSLKKKSLVSPIFSHLIGQSEVIKYSKEEVTEVTQAPISKVVASGTKKYQYMWCSKGGYRYYSNDQFKNPLTGFTHKSPDECAKNNAGHMTQLSDAAPQAPTTVYKTTPRIPTTTRCYDDFLGGITCSTY